MEKWPMWHRRGWQRFWPSTGCVPLGSELSIEERWYPDTALDDLLKIEEEKVNDTRLYRCLDRLLPHTAHLIWHKASLLEGSV
jgi:hypothetical protein